FPLQPWDRDVRHSRQVIGLVVAETFEQARSAAPLIETQYDVRTPTTSFRDEIPHAPVPPPGRRRQPPVERLWHGVGSIDEAYTASQVRVRATYSQRPEHHNPMEPHGVVAAWDGDRLTLYSGEQAPLLHATEVAAAMEVDTAQVNVIGPYVG